MKNLCICLIFLTACNPGTTTEMPEETVMESLLAENPDSLATLLEESVNPLLLSPAGRAEYAFYLTKTHRKQRRSLVNDTLIHFALDYYRQTASPRVPETYLLAAEQAWGEEELYLPEKIKLLEEALQFADRNNDTAGVREVAYRLADLYKAPEDTAGIEHLVRMTRRYDGEAWSILSLHCAIRRFTPERDLDSILLYDQRAVRLAREQNSPLEYRLTRSYAENLNLAGRSKEALHVVKEMERRIPVGNELLLTYANIWIGTGQVDSARACINTLQSIIEAHRKQRPEDPDTEIIEFVLGIYRVMIRIKEGKPYTIKEFAQIDRIMEKSRENISRDRERQFMRNKLQRENLMLDIERGRLQRRILWSGIGVLIIVTLLVFFYQRKLLAKERSVRKAKEQLHLHTIRLKENESIITANEELIRTLSGQLDESSEWKQEIERLVADNETLKRNNRSLREEMASYTESIRRQDQSPDDYGQLLTLHARLQERERFLTARLIAHTEPLGRLSKKPRYIDEAQWPEVIHAVNRLFDGFSYKLHTEHPALTDEDIRYCCLIKLRLTISVIATLTGISPSSVTKRKQRIKAKINRQCRSENDRPLEIYLWNY